MEKISVRNIKTTDLPQIYALEQTSFKQPYSSSYICTLAVLNAETFLVAESGRKIAGYAIATIEGEAGHIISIAVHPEYRNRKIGTELMLKLIEKLKLLGVSTIRLEVQRSNIAAQEMYKKLGFKSTHTLKNYYADGEDGIVMIKRLMESHD